MADYPIKLRLTCLCFGLVVLLIITNAHARFLGGFDNIVDSIATARALGRNVDEISESTRIFKKGDDFDTLIKKDPGFASSLGRNVDKATDAQIMLRRLDLPPGSRLAKEVLNLAPDDRHALMELYSTIKKILSRPNGANLLERLNKRGVLVVQRFGEKSIEPIEYVVKNDNLWKSADDAIVKVKSLDSANLKHIDDSLKGSFNNIGVDDVTKIGVINDAKRVDYAYETLKKYAHEGIDNLKKVTTKVWDVARGNPKKTFAAAGIAVVWTNPDIILKPTGKLKDNAVEMVEGIGQIIGQAMVDIPAGQMAGIQKGVQKSLNEKLPQSTPYWLSFIASWGLALTIFFAMLLLVFFIVPPTRFIVKRIAMFPSKILKQRKKNSNKKCI